MTALDGRRSRAGRSPEIVRVLVMPDDYSEACAVERLNSDEGSLARTVGASVLQCISGPGWHCYLAEDAHLTGRPLNHRASRLLAALGSDRLAHGVALFLDHAGTGPESDVTARVLAMARRTGTVVRDEG